MEQTKDLQVVDAVYDVPEISTHDRILDLAIKQGAPLEQLSRYLELRREHEAYEAKKQYDAALARVHAKIPTVIKSETNPQTRSKYAPLDKIIAQAKEVYTAEGFTITFYEGETTKDDHIRICADVAHMGGHSKTYYYDAPMEGKGIKGNTNMTATHAKASSVSYARRYLMCMIWNIPTSDDDGNGGKPAEFITKEQQEYITKEIKEIYDDSGKRFLEYMKAETVDTIMAKDFGKAINALKAVRARKGGAK